MGRKMNVNIYLEDIIHKKLSTISKKKHMSRNKIIRMAISEWLARHEKKEWPENFFNFTGVSDFPSTEALRKGLTPPPADPLS